MLALALCMFVVACGIADDEDDSSSAEHLHVLTAVAAVEATCATEGNRAYYVCECGKLFEDADATTETTLEAVKIAKLDHTYGNWNVTAEATCLADGLREKVCSECNDKVTEAIPALGHDEIPHAGQAATCTENGYNAYVTCSRCDYTTYTVIKALGHDYVFVAEVAATYENTGVMAHYECSRCDTKATKSGETYTEVTDADLVIAKRTLITGCSATTEEAGILHIETKKVKSMEYKGVYSVDGKAAYYFVGDGTKTNSETRFVTEGTDTSLPSADRIYNNYPAKAFSFKYKILNKSTAGVTDGEHWQYIVQILDPSYPILTFEPAVDGEWHEFTYTLTVDQIKLFAGFIVKMGSLDGEMLIADIKVETHEHISAWTKTTPATCEGAGEETGTCACGATTTRTITALGHDYKAVAEVAATYYETGVAAHYECARENCDTKATKSGETYTKVTDADLVLDKKTLLAETTAAERGTDGDYINTIVDGKLKYLDQKPADGTKYVMTANKNGQQVRAAYFSNSTPWTDELAGPDVQGNNWGFSEFRIALSGNITGISFEYRMIDTAPEGDVCQVEGVDSNGNHDKSWHMRHQIEYSNNVGYTNESRAVFGDRFLIADGAWHTVEFNVAKTGMKNILLKMYHFQGELLVTNYQVYVHTHDYTWETTTAATCEGTGEETGTCACGSTTTRDLAALGHDYKAVAEVAATYYETGVAAHYECARENCDTKATKSGETYTKVTDADLVLDKKTLLAETTAAERGTDGDYINTIVDGKLKYLDQKPADGTKYVMTANKNGQQVRAAYFSNSTPWTDELAGPDVQGNNWGFSEFRIALSGNITGISFEYRMIDTAPEGDVCQVEGVDSNGNHDKSWHMRHQIEYSNNVGYTNESRAVFGDRFLIADGAWHTVEFNVAKTGMKNILLKMYHFQGELLVTNYQVYVHTHDYTWETTTAATCEGTGEETGTCACGSTTTRDLAALGHDYKAVAEVAATYYETGVAAHYECAREGCDELFVKDGETYKKTTAAELVLKKLSLIDNATAVATEPENHLHIETGKVKKMTYGGLYNVDNRDAYYFYNEKVAGNAETRFVTFGTDTTKTIYNTYVFAPQRVRSFSFAYKIVNSCTDGVADKPAVPYITQILGSDGSYDVLEFNPTLNGEWGSYSYTLTDAQIEKFAGFIVKMGGLNGEMLIANIEVDAISLIDGCETATEPEAVLTIEEGKTKKMAYGGLYTVDDKVAYYFHTDLLDGWSETRFVTEGTDTKTKPDGVHYLFAPQTITSFSFEYKLRNISKTIITDDGANALCFSQIICSDSTYYPLALEMIADGKWHTVTYDVPEAQQALFSGFIVKLGRLKGEMLIANINAETVSLVEGCATATEPDAVIKLEEGKTKQMTYGGLYTVDGKAAYYFHTGTLLDWSETRFVTEGTDTTTKKGGKYTFAPKTVTSFSFEYKIRNISKMIITADDANAPYFAQILGSDSQYYPLELNMIADGKWHTVTYEVAEAQQSLFSGFIVKMGRLKGEMLIANINATVVE